MARVTRAHTVASNLTAGGFVDLRLTAEQQAQGPAGHTVDGFSVRNHFTADRTLLTVVGAYGPDWVMTLAQLRYRLEAPYIRYTTDGGAPGLGDHELLVRWATGAELRDRRQAVARHQAPVAALLRAEEQQQALAATGQHGLF